ncbi:MAG: xanthine dehydrogenase family protein subunit M [Rhodospirillaceae bacterium]|nr:xanthine dehydrogenase family protein subunit M [Rhodospirillaceae bacterium]MDE0619890.1 xanthine dehydrogenase family protein subunit M [Rhodospirillaceae bacterium]
MQLFHPTTIDEAVALLAAHDEARCIAGGQSLVAMLNLGLLDPPALVSLRKVAGLDRLTRHADGSVAMGAAVTQAALASAGLPGALAVLSEAAQQVAHPAIRNFGTVGGALCHADPAADLPPAFVAADARLTAIGPGGARRIRADDFFLDYLTTALAEDEILTEIRLSPPPPGSVGAYHKFARVDGDYATVSVAVALTLEGGICRAARVVLGSCAAQPLRLDAADAALADTRLDDEAVARAGALLQDAAEPLADMRGSAEYRRRIIPGLVARTVEAARARSEAPA